jgi:hypothetical protein
LPRDLRDRLLERLLHLGQGGDRDPGGQFLVQHVILARVAVGEHVVAQLLGVPQACAVAQHQPGVRAQHRDVVGHGARVGRPNADVDQGDPAAVGPDQVVAGHLRQPVGRRTLARRRAVLGDHFARLHEPVVARIAVVHQLPAHAHEGVDVELVVREDHEVLEVVRTRAGVVQQALQRVVDPRPAKRGERARLVRAELGRAVDDGVVHPGQVGHVEQVAQRGVGHRALGAQFLRLVVDVALIGGVHRDRLVRFADLHRHAVVLDQKGDLFAQVAPEHIRPGHGGLVQAGPRDEAVGQTRVHLGVRARGHPDERIGRPHRAAGRLAVQVRLEVGAQEGGVALVDLLDPRQRCVGIAEALGRI